MRPFPTLLWQGLTCAPDPLAAVPVERQDTWAETIELLCSCKHSNFLTYRVLTTKYRLCGRFSRRRLLRLALHGFITFGWNPSDCVPLKAITPKAYNKNMTESRRFDWTWLNYSTYQTVWAIRWIGIMSGTLIDWYITKLPFYKPWKRQSIYAIASSSIPTVRVQQTEDVAYSLAFRNTNTLPLLTKYKTYPQLIPVWCGNCKPSYRLLDTLSSKAAQCVSQYISRLKL